MIYTYHVLSADCKIIQAYISYQMIPQSHPLGPSFNVLSSWGGWGTTVSMKMLQNLTKTRKLIFTDGSINSVQATWSHKFRLNLSGVFSRQTYSTFDYLFLIKYSCNDRKMTSALHCVCVDLLGANSV